VSNKVATNTNLSSIVHFFKKFSVDYTMIVYRDRDGKNDLREKRQFCKGRIWDYKKGRDKNQWIGFMKYLQD
jgi:hypothetical protein